MKKILICAFLISPIIGFTQQIDSRSSAVADSVMIALGGKQNWEKVHYLKWNFFGRRTIYWDKWTGDVRIEISGKKLVILTNINSKKGHVFRNTSELMQPDSNAYFMDRGYKIWANDSYWLLMPFKLKDPGVNISYVGTSRDTLNNDCYVMEVTFNKVGVTPENMYHIYVDRKNYLVTQWEYFEKSSEQKPDIKTPWWNYERHGNILLSGDRGPDGKITDIEVMDRVRTDLFSRF
ncbi:MAG: hypothetical protein H0W62_13620 [Chitinophagales bacterium]|nr:hypothetical protein [Chitinophagales bacterium]